MEYKPIMEKNNKSKYIVMGFISFVILIYTGSYFYTKDNNQRLLSSPRIVMLISDEVTVNEQFASLTIEERRSTAREMFENDIIFSLSQSEYDGGINDIAVHYKDNIMGQNYVVADCMAYSEILKVTMEKDAQNKLKSNWVFSACGII